MTSNANYGTVMISIQEVRALSCMELDRVWRQLPVQPSDVSYGVCESVSHTQGFACGSAGVFGLGGSITAIAGGIIKSSVLATIGALCSGVGIVGGFFWSIACYDMREKKINDVVQGYIVKNNGCDFDRYFDPASCCCLCQRV